jgi:high-affinity iron transporter
VNLEALLVVVAMIAFLRKAERTDVLRYVHAGWIAALASGGLTSRHLPGRSERRQPRNDGGFFGHFCRCRPAGRRHLDASKSLAGRWQAYVKQKLSAALSKKVGHDAFPLVVRHRVS